MQNYIKQRYLCTDYAELAQRVSSVCARNAEERTLYEELILSQTFIPAGNTLLAGVSELTPNCCVLGQLTDTNFADMLALSQQLWRQRTGIGYDLSGLSDPVGALLKLSAANDAIELGHRPKRGNMGVLDASHPQIRQFVQCKSRSTNIYNFNISVAIRDEIDEDLLSFIAAHAWNTGDPGLIFLTRAEDYGPVHADDLPPIVTCVPCGEQFMHAYETCNLGSINLNSDWLLDKDQSTIDYGRLRYAVHAAITLLDRVVDLLVFPSDEIKQVSLAARRIGLGVMGWADYLQRQRISYDSPEALRLAYDLSRAITRYAEERSGQLAAIYGPCAYSPDYRNLSLTCIAPTGGITGLTNNKGYAIEPYFDEAVLYDYHTHINMQAAWQSGMHNAVSKTINLPASATVQTVIDAYHYARQVGVKGITVYRDGSKDQQPMALCPNCV
jgi:ribonucleoside-diphosphate reductase alpha chain